MCEPREDASPVLVAVVDSGWDLRIEHPRVLPSQHIRMDVGVPARLEPTQESDLIGHGTMCARAILAQSDIVVLPVRIFDRTLDCGPNLLIAALGALVAVRPAVVNLSLCTKHQRAAKSLYVTCETLNTAGSVIVAAEQNGGRIGMPAIFENAIGVGVRHAPDGHEISFPEAGTLDMSIAYGLCIELDGRQNHIVRSSSGATAVVSALVAAWIVEHGRADADAIRNSFNTDPQWWRDALKARCVAAA